MAMQDINALLAALKSKEGGDGMPASAAASPDVSLDPPADPSDDTGDDHQTSPEENAQIVQILQTQYPKLFLQISAQVEASSPDDSDASSGGGADLSDMMGGMSS